MWERTKPPKKNNRKIFGITAQKFNKKRKMIFLYKSRWNVFLPFLSSVEQRCWSLRESFSVRQRIQRKRGWKTMKSERRYLFASGTLFTFFSRCFSQPSCGHISERHRYLCRKCQLTDRLRQTDSEQWTCNKTQLNPIKIVFSSSLTYVGNEIVPLTSSLRSAWQRMHS